ncbi:MAG: arylesterase [Chthoniobacterales bacterium]
MGKLRFALTLCLFASGLSSSAGDVSAPVPDAATKTLVFLGDSLTAGHGVRADESFPSLIEEKIRSTGLSVVTQNAGVSGDTTAGGLRRIDWLLQRKIDVLVIELGANDGLRGLPTATIRTNLQGIIEKTKATYPGAKFVVAGMQIPPNMGSDYAASFQRVFPELAAANQAELIPFLLDGVGGHRELNQSDLIHPTAAGHRVIAENIWRVLRPLLQRISQ